jgi:urease accessory protein
MFKKLRRAALPGTAFATTLLMPSLARAHSGATETTGFLSGASHPLGGLDHILAMLAVGLWASQLRGRALWAMPAAFVGVMALSGALGMAGMSMPFVEHGIVLSVLALGVLVAAAARLPLAASVALVGAFALFHGSAHGAEMPANANGLMYGAGFLAATAMLHACGIAAGTLVKRPVAASVVRLAGLAIACGGAYLVMS